MLSRILFLTFKKCILTGELSNDLTFTHKIFPVCVYITHSQNYSCLPIYSTNLAPVSLPKQANCLTLLNLTLRGNSRQTKTINFWSEIKFTVISNLNEDFGVHTNPKVLMI